MTIKTIGLFFSIVVVFFLGAVAGVKIASDGYQSQIAKIKGDAAIYRTQAEKYAEIIREIREKAAQATVAEKAQ